jgi:Pex2 / Pex12 amino terminal region
MGDFKVNQLDSHLLDRFYQNIISDQILKPFPFDTEKKFLVKVLVKTVYLYQTLWKNSQSQGNKIYNLSYSMPSNKYLAVHYILEVFHILHSCYKDNIGTISKIWNLGILANWVLFLVTGKYRTLMERLGKVSLFPTDPSRKLKVDYMYTQRVLFFQVLTDTIKTIIPYLKIESLIRFFNDELSFKRSSEDSCIICGEEDVVSPIRYSNCRHLACYICHKGLSHSKCYLCKA